MPRKKHQAVDAFIGAWVRLRRLNLKMSQEDLSNRLGVTFQQIQKYEKGVNRVSASRLLQLAAALAVPVQFFFDGLDVDKDAPPPDGMSEETTPLDPYLDFVSSPSGVELNKAFMHIEDEPTRRHLLAMVADIARVSRPRNR